MKSIISSSIIALLATTSFARPSGNAIAGVSQGVSEVGLVNDQTGAFGIAQSVPNDGVPRVLTQVYAGTSLINSEGKILVSSASLFGEFQFKPTCIFAKADGTPITTLNNTKTFAKLGTDPNLLQIVDWTTFTLQCTSANGGSLPPSSPPYSVPPTSASSAANSWSTWHA